MFKYDKFRTFGEWEDNGFEIVYLRKSPMIYIHKCSVYGCKSAQVYLQTLSNNSLLQMTILKEQSQNLFIWTAQI